MTVIEDGHTLGNAPSLAETAALAVASVQAWHVQFAKRIHSMDQRQLSFATTITSAVAH